MLRTGLVELLKCYRLYVKQVCALVAEVWPEMEVELMPA